MFLARLEVSVTESNLSFALTSETWKTNFVNVVKELNQTGCSIRLNQIY